MSPTFIALKRLTNALEDFGIGQDEPVDSGELIDYLANALPNLLDALGEEEALKKGK